MKRIGGKDMKLIELDQVNETVRRGGNLERRQAVNPRVVLEELFQLLEEYAPGWYTEEHHIRAVTALMMSRAPIGQETSRSV
jgi:hypothetical protein